MSHRRPPLPALLLAAAACLWLAAAALVAGPAPQGPGRDPEIEDASDAQPPGEERLIVTLDTDVRAQLRLAFPEIAGVSRYGGDFGRAARELDATLRNDLEQSGVFEIQGPWAFRVLELTGELGRDFEQYRSLGNELVLLGEVRPERDRLVFEGRLYDLASGQSVLAKRYRGPLDAARRIAHVFADEVIEYASGRRGISQTRIAYTSERGGRKEIWVMDFDGANQRAVTAHRSTSMSPAWSPSSAALLYTSFVNGAPGIYRADLASGRKFPVVTDGDQNISPTFSPDGRRIAFSRALGGNSEIFVADADGSNLRRLTHSPAIDTNPAWSPTGGQIAFTSSRAGNPHLFVMDAEGTDVRRVSTAGNLNDGASWGPEGDRVTYSTRRRGNGFDVAVTDLVTLDTRVLTSGPGSHEDPSFSPDGRRIAFSSNRSGSRQIWVMSADGSDLRGLTGEGSNSLPAWSPYPTR